MGTCLGLMAGSGPGGGGGHARRRTDSLFRRRISESRDERQVGLVVLIVPCSRSLTKSVIKGCPLVGFSKTKVDERAKEIINCWKISNLIHLNSSFYISFSRRTFSNLICPLFPFFSL